MEKLMSEETQEREQRRQVHADELADERRRQELELRDYMATRRREVDQLISGYQADMKKRLADMDEAHQKELESVRLDNLEMVRGERKTQMLLGRMDIEAEASKIKDEAADEARKKLAEAERDAREIKDKAERHVSETTLRHYAVVEARLATCGQKQLELDAREKELDVRKAELDSVSNLWSIQQEMRSMKHHVDDLAGRSFSAVRSAEARAAGLEQELALARATEADLREQVTKTRSEPSYAPLRMVLSGLKEAFGPVHLASSSEVDMEEFVCVVGGFLLDSGTANHFHEALRIWPWNQAIDDWLCVKSILRGKRLDDCHVHGRCDCSFVRGKCLRLLFVDYVGRSPRRIKLCWSD